MAVKGVHDCFGAILRAGDGPFTFISAQTGKVYASLDQNGLKIIKDRGKVKDENTISLRTLEVLITQIKKVKP
jgi:hypothetical protein